MRKKYGEAEHTFKAEYTRLLESQALFRGALEGTDQEETYRR